MRDHISAIVYTSGTGFTRRYAQMLGEKTGLAVYDLKASGGPAKDTPVIFMGWLCAGKLKGLKSAVKRWPVQAVCAVGLGTDEMNRVERLAPSLGCPPGSNLFYLRGGFAPEKLTGVAKVMMGMMRKAMQSKPPADEDGKVMLDAFVNGGDWVDAARLDGVAAYLEGSDA
ncbi:MAG: hypothetical protein EOM52_01050 [Clostridia bacterium]|nr:hypothetical protein [Clostridia bacterium]